MMFSINEIVNPLLIIMPILLMVFAGYGIGLLISHVRKVKPIFVRDLIYGTIALNFLFISGFIFFGVLIHVSKLYYSIFTFMLIGLSLVCCYLLFRKISRSNFKIFKLFFSKSSLVTLLSPDSNKLILLGIIIFSILLVYQSVIIYYHTIFGGEFDAIYIFLPISKSILLGNGLNHDYFLGADINLAYPPFTQSLDAWLLYSFSYSSVKIFPIYFVFFASVIIYYFARNLTKDTVLSLVSSSAFLITPALLFTSSKYSLQQDIPFIFFLTAAFYFLSELVMHDKPVKTNILILSICLSILPLCREIGLVVSFAIFFLIPAIKFTGGDLKLRSIFTFLSLLPFYLISLYDILHHGFTNTVIVRLTIVILANTAIFYCTSLLKNHYPFILLLKGNLKFFVLPLVIPLILLTINMILFLGPYNILTISSSFDINSSLFRLINEKPNEISFDIGSSLQYIPQIQLLFASIQLGSIFLIFKLRGYFTLIENIKVERQFPLMLLLSVILLIIWSYLLGSGIGEEANRHILYFIPLFSIVIVVGMKAKQQIQYNLYYYGLIIFAAYYFIYHNLSIWNYNNIFAGFLIEKPIISVLDFVIAIILIIPLIFFELVEKKFKFQNSNVYNFHKYLPFVCIAMPIILVIILSSSGINISSIQKVDSTPNNQWEGDVFEVIDYLNNSNDTKNVFSIRAPAIPFFTNRTNYDTYLSGTYNSITPLLLIENTTDLDQKIRELNIGYIVVPNEQNDVLFKYTQNVLDNFDFIQILDTDQNFEKIELEKFDVYKYIGNHD